MDRPCTSAARISALGNLNHAHPLIALARRPHNGPHIMLIIIGGSPARAGLLPPLLVKLFKGCPPLLVSTEFAFPPASLWARIYTSVQPTLGELIPPHLGLG